LAKFNVSGPLPLLPVSAVQISLSPALNPELPLKFQLHGVSGHTTATKLFGPVNETEPDNPPLEVKVGLAVKVAASAPNCDHTMESLAPRPAGLFTTETLSARAAVVANRTSVTKATQLRKVHLYTDVPP